jgi:hypothetical protein
VWITFDYSPRNNRQRAAADICKRSSIRVCSPRSSRVGIWPSHNSAFLWSRLTRSVANELKIRGEITMLRGGVCVLAGLCLTSVATAGEFKLPPEVTPAMRSACESDDAPPLHWHKPDSRQGQDLCCRKILSARETLPSANCAGRPQTLKAVTVALVGDEGLLP